MIPLIAVYILFMALLSYFQIKRLSAREGKKAVFAYSFFMSLALIVGSLLIAGVDIPSQSSLTKIFEPIGEVILGK